MSTRFIGTHGSRMGGPMVFCFGRGTVRGGVVGSRFSGVRWAGHYTPHLGFEQIQLRRLCIVACAGASSSGTLVLSHGFSFSSRILQRRQASNQAMERTGGPLCAHFRDDFHSSTARDARSRPPSLILFSLGDYHAYAEFRRNRRIRSGADRL